VKVGVLLIAIVALTACATNSERPGASVESDYSATRNDDGSISLLVTASTRVPTADRDANLELGPMLEAAASKECPTGYELRHDPLPAVRTESARLIATLGGLARCK
jgi:hypothetical protein